MDETIRFEAKRVSGKMVHKALETVVAFANTEGGFLVLGLEDLIRPRVMTVCTESRKIRRRLTNSAEKLNMA
jgi:predicted HTH transcriptional regulator